MAVKVKLSNNPYLYLSATAIFVAFNVIEPGWRGGLAAALLVLALLFEDLASIWYKDNTNDS